MPCKFNTVYIDGVPGGNAFEIFTNMSRHFSSKYSIWSSNVLLEKLESLWWNGQQNEQWVIRCFSKLLYAPKNNMIIFGSVLRILSRIYAMSESKRALYNTLLKQYLDPDNNSITLLISPDERDINGCYHTAVATGLPVGLLAFDKNIRDINLTADKYKDDFNIVKILGNGKLAKAFKAVTKESLSGIKMNPTDHKNLRF